MAITASGKSRRGVSTLASSTEGFADGAGAAAQFSFPRDVAVDSSGNAYVGDTNNHLIRKITPADRIEDRVVSTLAGSGTEGFANGTGNTAQFEDPYDLAVDSSGNIYVTDSDNHRIRKIEYKVPWQRRDGSSCQCDIF